MSNNNNSSMMPYQQQQQNQQQRNSFNSQITPSHQSSYNSRQIQQPAPPQNLWQQN